jgi:high-affinity iron transporter
MFPSRQRRTGALLLLTAILSFVGYFQVAMADDERVPGIVHMLGYIGVDYPGTVSRGKVIVAAEYAEQREFAGRVHAQLNTLPDVPEKAGLLKQAVELGRLIERKAAGNQVVALTDRMRDQLLRAYNVTVTPHQAPDLVRGAKLYEAQCAGCHGAQGHGDGPLAKGLNPVPADFHARARQEQRSVYAVFNAITLGVQGTAMQGYAQTLKEGDRWALAFHVANYLASDEDRHAGAALWSSGKYQTQFVGLRSVTSLSPQQAMAFGTDGPKVLAWLRSQPQLLTSKESPLAFSKRLLEESLARYREGKFELAYELAVTSYLEGFELAEVGLSAVAPTLKQDLEREMYGYRNLIKARAPEGKLMLALVHIEAQLDEASSLLGGTGLAPGVAYSSSLVILLREGLEAILLLAVVVAFLIKTGRRDALKYIHIGWVTALLLGIATWVAAAYVVDISGASRELTEGVTALIAAAILLYVGFWLHNKLQAQRWKAFIETKVQGALDNGTLWSIALVAFIAVYREVFETVLFYQTLWLQAGSSGQHMVLVGFLSAAAALVVLAWLIFKFSVRLPLRLFFAVNSVLLYLLAVVFAGKGVVALQEAGVLPVSSVNFPTIEVLGVYPNLQSLGLQGLLVLAAVVFINVSRRKKDA